MECIKNFYIHNFKLRSIPEFDESIFNNGKSVYEVIRITQGIPLFLEDHLNRLFYSADLLNSNINESYCDIETLIDELIKKNNTFEGKIKLVIRFEERNEKDIILYFTPHYFPTTDEYKNGVIVGICSATRINPNAKLLNSEARKRANNRIVEENLFEVLLVNDLEHITEGSRSNVFFIKNDSVITPPEREILNGITRQKIIKLCKKNNINLIEKTISLSDLKQMDAIFLSGTSINVLPIKQIAGTVYDTNHPILIQIMNLYSELVNHFIRQRKLT